MMSLPGTHNFAIYQGDRYYFEIVLKTGPDELSLVPINLTGATVSSEIRASATTETLGVFTCVVLDGPGGQVGLTLPPTVSELLPAQVLVYDVQVAFTPGVDDRTYLKGTITVTAEVTKL